MKLRTTVGTIDGTPPGGIAEVPDNEAAGLIKSGIMSLPEEGTDDSGGDSDEEDEKPVKKRATRSNTSKSTGDEDTEVSEDEAANTTKEG